MLRKIILHNFQRHKNLELSFGPGVNAITGSSDVGKSTVIRALRWVLENRPQGVGFLNWDSDLKDGVSVTLIFQGGDEIIRQRTQTSNSYIVNGVQLDAVRTDIPKEVAEIANIHSCCLQTQFSPYFLLQDTAGEVARKLNTVAGLEIISESLKSIGNVERTARANAETAKEEAGAVRISLERLEPLTDAAEKFQRAESAREVLLSLQSKIGKIQQTTKSLQQVNINLTRFASINTAMALVTKLKKDDSILTTVSEQLRKVKYSVNRLKEIQGKLGRETSLTAITRKIKVVQYEQEALKDMKERKDALYSIITELASAKEEMKQKEVQIQTVQKELSQMKKELGQCPLCGGDFQ